MHTNTSVLAEHGISLDNIEHLDLEVPIVTGNQRQGDVYVLKVTRDLQLYDEPARILIVHNASLDKGGHRRQFGLPVPARHSDPIAAAADLFDVPRAAYAGTVRAS